MANTKATDTTTPDDTTPDVAPAEPAKRGRKATRDPNGKSFSGFFSEDEVKRISKARFKGEHEQVNDLIRTATLEYVDKVLGDE